MPAILPFDKNMIFIILNICRQAWFLKYYENYYKLIFLRDFIGLKVFKPISTSVEILWVSGTWGGKDLKIPINESYTTSLRALSKKLII